MTRLSWSGLAAALLTIPLLSPGAQAQVGANMKDQMIFRYCSKAMTDDFNKAGKTPPKGMVDYTCGCVVQQVDARASIDQAKAICQANAQQKYPVQ